MLKKLILNDNVDITLDNWWVIQAFPSYKILIKILTKWGEVLIIVLFAQKVSELSASEISVDCTLQELSFSADKKSLITLLLIPLSQNSISFLRLQLLKHKGVQISPP